MDKETLNALQGSIKKWEGILVGITTDRGVSNCPLCAEFYGWRSGGSRCSGCPVAQKTGQSFCEGSPYTGWVKAEDDMKAYNKKNDEKGNLVLTRRGKLWATKELNFLKSLLPQPDEQKVG